MGFTHYYWLKANIEGGFDEKLLNQVRGVVEDFSNILVFEYDQPDKKPIVHNSMIRFNGKGDLGHETFTLQPYKREFEFTKTARKPYNLPMCIILLLVKYQYREQFVLRSDGFCSNRYDEDWHKAKAYISSRFQIEIDLDEIVNESLRR